MHAASGDQVSLCSCGLGQLLTYFVRLGAFGFGGPIALTGAMQLDLVDRRRWISLQEYKEGLALSQLAPGPLAAQLAIYPWMDKVRGNGRHTRCLCFHPAFPIHGARACCAIPPIWRPRLDAGCFLWRRCGSNRRHREECVEARQEHARVKTAVLGVVSGHCGCDRLD